MIFCSALVSGWFATMPPMYLVGLILFGMTSSFLMKKMSGPA